jgi:hypothetical protein
VSSKEGTFSKELGHESQKKICDFWTELFFCCGRSYYTNSYRSYSVYNSVQSYGFGTEIEIVLGTDFEAKVIFMFIVYGSYKTMHTIDYWHGK